LHDGLDLTLVLIVLRNEDKRVRCFVKTVGLAAATVVALGVAAAHADDDGSWEVRVRAVRLTPANKSDAYAPLAIPADAIHIDGKWIPDLDFEHFFTPHWSSFVKRKFPRPRIKSFLRYQQHTLSTAI
jgi:hypothetical protein